MDRRPKNADTGAGGGAVEVSAELAVVVANDELGPAPKGVASRSCCAVHCAVGCRPAEPAEAREIGGEALTEGRIIEQNPACSTYPPPRVVGTHHPVELVAGPKVGFFRSEASFSGSTSAVSGESTSLWGIAAGLDAGAFVPVRLRRDRGATLHRSPRRAGVLCDAVGWRPDLHHNDIYQSTTVLHTATLVGATIAALFCGVSMVVCRDL